MSLIWIVNILSVFFLCVFFAGIVIPQILLIAFRSSVAELRMEKYNNWKLKFYTIWAGQAVSLITSAILQMAIIFYLTEKTGSAMVLSMASLVGFLPYAVFGPAIGVLVDRHDRKKIMIGADLIIAAAGAVLAIVALYMELPIWMVMVVLFIRSIGTAFHTPALNAVTPLLVPEEQLTKCAGYSQSLQSISYIVSPAVAALLYSVWELNAIIAIDVLGAVIASITVAIVRIPKLGDQVQSLKPNFIREMKEGMAVLRQNKGLFALLLVGTLYMFVYMPINALYPLITMEYFNGTPMHISITEIAYASGMLIGGLLLGLFGNYQKRILLITASIFMMGISLTISGLLPQSGFFIFVVCCAIMGLSGPFYSGVQTALFQEKIKPEYLGRVFSLTGSIMSLAMPIGLILSGFFADRIDVNHWFLLSGVLIIGIAIACPMITEVRKLDLKQNS
ncbi:macrolide efflux MFS transporter Mef(A) [Bacteroides faecis]